MGGRWTDGRMDGEGRGMGNTMGKADRQMGKMDRQMDGKEMDGWMDGKEMDGWMDGENRGIGKVDVRDG